ncbi:hypothetical protein MBLNU230_g8583t1 [Neophaeotheca triangularis]
MATENRKQSPTSVVAHFVKQLQDGCGNKTCTETMCLTGRRNVTTNPIRQYTPRSARAMALMLADTAGMRKHLCPHLQDESKTVRDAKPGPKDTASIAQQLADTSTVQAVSGGVALDAIYQPDRLAREYCYYWHCLDGLRKALPDNVAEQGFRLLSNKKAARLVFESLEWVCGKPNSDHRGVRVESTTEPMLDNERKLRFVAHACRAVASRLVLQKAVEARSKSVEAHLSIAHLVMNKVFGKGDTSEAQSAGDRSQLSQSSVFELQWALVHVFRYHWDPSQRIPLGSAMSGALHLLDHFARLDRVSILAFLSSMDTGSWRLHKLDVFRSWKQYLDRRDPYETHLLAFPNLVRDDDVYFYFRAYNHQEMAKASAASDTASRVLQSLSHDFDHFHGVSMYDERAQHLETAYLLLTVSRTKVLEDAMNQLWHRREHELRKPLRVRLGEIDMIEVGHDLGGVQIEFFNLVCKSMMSEDLGMFASDPLTGKSWFKPCSLQPLHIFELFGIIVGLAVYNGIAIPVSFPKAFYGFLHSGPTNPVELIDDHWPVEARSLGSLKANELDGLDYSFPLEANGLRLSVSDYQALADGRMMMKVSDVTPIHSSHGTTSKAAVSNAVPKPNSDGVFELGWPGWDVHKSNKPDKPLTAKILPSFIDRYTFWLAKASVWPQLHAFTTGFNQVIPQEARSFIRPDSLQKTIEGDDLELDIQALRDATRYDGYTPSDPYISDFWEIAAAWSQPEQRQLVKFVTAVERIPAGGSGSIRFEIKRAEAFDVEALPTSSTCFGTLNLPRYGSREVLERKLGIAVKYGVEGFGIS